MIKKLLTLSLLAVVLVGCSNDEAFSELETSNETVASKNASISPNEKAISRYIVAHHGKTSRSAAECMMPLFYHGG